MIKVVGVMVLDQSSNIITEFVGLMLFTHLTLLTRDCLLLRC